MSKKNVLVLLSYIVIAFLAYGNCLDILIPGDNYSLFYIFDNTGFAGGIKNLGLYLSSFPFIYYLYNLIGITTSAWIGISIILHITNAFLVFLLGKLILKSFTNTSISIPSFFAGLIFLISPYQTEAILWTPTNMVILIATLFSICSILLLLTYFISGQRFSQYGFYILFLLAVYAYETAFMLPGISIVLYWLYYCQKKTNLSPKQFILQLLFPQIVILFSYFLITKIVFNYWIWHSGEFTISVSIFSIIGTGLKYLAKFFIFYRYLPHEYLDPFAKFIFNNYVFLGLLFIITVGISGYLFRIIMKRNRNIGYILMALFVCFIISLIPVLPLDSSFLNYIYPDRYGYLPSLFFYLFLVFTLFQLTKKIAVPLLISYSMLCGLLLMRTTQVWNTVNKYCTQVTESYKPFLSYNRVYVLNIPAYYKGIAAFRSAFAETIYRRYNHSSVEKIRVISGCYQEFRYDTLTSVSRKQDTIFVIARKKQTPYFSTNGGWAESYETNEYSVGYDSDGCAYTLRFKQKIPVNSVFIYFANNQWEKVD